MTSWIVRSLARGSMIMGDHSVSGSFTGSGFGISGCFSVTFTGGCQTFGGAAGFQLGLTGAVFTPASDFQLLAGGAVFKFFEVVAGVFLTFGLMLGLVVGAVLVIFVTPGFWAFPFRVHPAIFKNSKELTNR